MRGSQADAQIDDPILQYPINREIFHLTQSSTANSSPRTTISKASSRSTFSMSTPSLLLPEQSTGTGTGLGLGSMRGLKQQNPASASAINLGMPLASGSRSRSRLSPIPSVTSSRSHSSLSLYSTETHEQMQMENSRRPSGLISTVEESDESPSLTHVRTPRTADSLATIREQQQAAAAAVTIKNKLTVHTSSQASLSRTVSLDSDGEAEHPGPSTGRRTGRRESCETSDGESLSPAKREHSPVKFDAPWGRSAPNSPHLTPGTSPRASPSLSQKGLLEDLKPEQWGASYAVAGTAEGSSAEDAAQRVGVKRHDSFASVRTFGRPGELPMGGKRFSAESVFSNSNSKRGSSERADSPVKRGSRDGELAGMWDLRQALEASAKTAEDAAGKVPRVSFLKPDAGAYARAQLEAEAKGKGEKGVVGAEKRGRRMSGWL